MYHRFSATGVLIGSLLVVTPQLARAQTAEIKRAALACDSKDWEARIAGCARLINSSAKASLKLIAYQQRGYGYLMNGQFDLALADYNHVIELNPKSAGAYVDRAAAYAFIGSDDGVIDSAEQAIKLDPKLARAYFARAQGYSAKREYDRALLDLNKTISLDPKFFPAFAFRAGVWMSKKELDLALADADEAVRLDPKGQGYGTRCSVFAERAEWDNAIADCTRMVDLNLSNRNFGNRYSSATYYDRADVYFKKGDLDLALTDLNQSIRLNPTNAASYVKRADVWRAKGNLDSALNDLEHATRISPNMAKIYATRGLVDEARGDIEQAKTDYQAALARPDINRQGFIDNSKREKDNAKARLAVLSDASVGVSPQASPPSSLQSPAALPAPAGRRIALVIGNGAYTHANALPNPANDARAIAKNLRDIGFDVSDGTDLDRSAMNGLVVNFIRRAATAHVALLFYAGHGMQIDGKNYLLPVDAKFDGAFDLAKEAIDMDTILAGLDDRIRANILILDACRDNPLLQKDAQLAAGRSVTIGSGLAAPSGLGAGATSGAGTLLVFATSPGKVALDGDGGHSPFTEALARHLSTPGLKVQQMLTRVRADVVAATKNRQVPWSNSSLLGEVYLASAKP